jgi:phage-related protein
VIYCNQGESDPLHQIYFYQDKSGREPVREYLEALLSKQDKDSRIKANKINDYIQALSEYGKKLGEPYLKHLDGDIWELRPLRDRILFAAWINDSFVLLHVFMKKTQKTPAKEIEQAKRELRDLYERGLDHE